MLILAVVDEISFNAILPSILECTILILSRYDIKASLIVKSVRRKQLKKLIIQLSVFILLMGIPYLIFVCRSCILGTC